MSKRFCSNCLFGSDCPQRVACEDYAPIDEDGSIDEYIETNREIYLSEWSKYVGEDDFVCPDNQFIRGI